MKHRALVLLLAGFCALPLAACSDDSPDDGSDNDGSDNDGPPGPQYVGAKGVTIREVSIYQSLKRQLMADGAPVTEGVPLIAGRDAVIRVFYDTNADYSGEVIARLDIVGGEPIELTASLVGSSTETDIQSTINFTIPGDRIGANFEYSIAILQEGEQADDNAAAHHPATGTENLTIEGAANKFRVLIAPFEYNFDGSGRLPDISEAAVEGYRNRLKQIYPVSDVEVTVREPTPWNQEIDAFGNGWQEVGFEVFGMRNQDGTSDDVYYYGMFNPASSFGAYCSGGCLLGVTLLNNQPPDVGDVTLRLALGIGYEEFAADTMAHELGHSHGREHADCGGPDGVDPQYPHPGGRIGIWGLDTATLTLYNPDTTTDIMGYCDNQWVSDYTYTALFNRAKNVNQPKWNGAPPQTRYAVIGLDGYGHATWGGVSKGAKNLGGRKLSSTITRNDGRSAKTEALYLPWDHLAGGMALVPLGEETPAQVEVELDGVKHTVQTGF